MRIKRRDLYILIESLLAGDYQPKITLIEGIADYAAKKALLSYVENTDEATLKSKIRKLIGPETKDGIYGRYYNNYVLINEAFKRVEWWFKNISALVDKNMLIKAITLFFDDREKFYDEVNAWINKNYGKLYNSYIKSFSDDELRDIAMSISRTGVTTHYGVYGDLDRDEYDDEEEYEEAVEFKKMVENYDRKELESDFMKHVITKPVVFSDDGTLENAKGRLELDSKANIMKDFANFKKKASDDSVFSLILKGIYSFISG